MVTRMVIRITSSDSEAAAFAATSSSSTATTAAAADSIISNAPFEQNHTEEEMQTNLCNHPNYSKRAQHPSPLCWQHGAKESICSYSGCHNKGILLGLCADHGGLVQLCRQKGCINEVDFERRGGLCYIHQKGPMYGDQSDSDYDSEDNGKIHLCSFRGCISNATTDEGLCDGHAAHVSNYSLDEVGKKHDRPSEDSISNKDDIKRQKVDAFIIDLSYVPPQPPIPKSVGRIKEGASKYTGVTFNKAMNKWHARITIEGKQRFIGSYENEEEAAVDYARAVFKLKGQGALDKARETKEESSSFIIELTDVPPQPLIPKSAGYIKEGASKYKGVSFNKQRNKWHALIMVEGKQRLIGYYENEEEAAVNYARAVFKYKGKGALDKTREQNSIIDLSDVPPQPPIPKSAGRIKDGASKYIGVYFNKPINKWYARIMIEGKQRNIGSYENEEEAAVDYARAVFKYKGTVQYSSTEDNLGLRVRVVGTIDNLDKNLL